MRINRSTLFSSLFSRENASLYRTCFFSLYFFLLFYRECSGPRNCIVSRMHGNEATAGRGSIKLRIPLRSPFSQLQLAYYFLATPLPLLLRSVRKFCPAIVETATSPRHEDALLFIDTSFHSNAGGKVSFSKRNVFLSRTALNVRRERSPRSIDFTAGRGERRLRKRSTSGAR